MDNHPEEGSPQYRSLVLSHPRIGDKTYIYSPMQTFSELRTLF